MYHKLEDFYREWAYESDMTLKLFSLIDPHRFHEQLHPRVRSIARLSFHITETIGEMMARTGIQVEGYHEDGDLFWTPAELSETYSGFSASLVDQLKKNWSDADLSKKDNMYGEEWTRGTTLSVLLRHQTHHRGELVILMRLLGMKVIGVYGPASEEWSQMGMTPME